MILADGSVFGPINYDHDTLVTRFRETLHRTEDAEESVVIAMDTFPLGWLYGGAVAAWLGNEEALVISAMGGTPVLLLGMLTVLLQNVLPADMIAYRDALVYLRNRRGRSGASSAAAAASA